MNVQTPSPWHGLLFLHGHIADPALARQLAGDARPRASRRPGAAAALLHHLLYLGGRPMHAGLNFDIDEPFADLAPPAPATCVSPACG